MKDKINDEETTALIKYCETAGSVSVAQIQRDFEWGYLKARDGIAALVVKKYLTSVDDGLYQFVVNDKKYGEYAFDIDEETRFIKRFISRYEKYAPKDGTKNTSVKSNGSLRQMTFDELPEAVQKLVEIAINCSKHQSAARYGLRTRLDFCMKGTEEAAVYVQAFEYVKWLDDDGYKALKKRFAENI